MARCSLREDSEEGQAVVRPAAAGGTLAVPVGIGSDLASHGPVCVTVQSGVRAGPAGQGQ